MASSSLGVDSFNPSNVNLDTADPAQVVCYLNSSKNDYDGRLGARISALFVILVVSTCVTFFPVVAKRVRWLKIPLYVYLFARYFGAGVIVATAFIHLLDPAYGEIGPNTCVGMTGGWASYSWCPAIVLTSVIMIFLLDFAAERYVEVKYGVDDGPNIQEAVTGHVEGSPNGKEDHSNREEKLEMANNAVAYEKKFSGMDYGDSDSEVDREASEHAFRQQIAAFLILEFGVMFHSIIIGLNLGVVGQEFNTLYPVIVFHQSFEGLGIGARMSAIPFKRGSWLPWILCAAYGLTTPIAIAVGLGVRTTYNPGSFTANVVSGVLDSMSAGILIYTGLVELLARDFLFNPLRTKDNKRIAYMIICVLLGTGVMALLGKWA
ncbi:high-affinity Zn(2+) transporter zrt1 [Varicellaria rhodocarpa]|nr:high-affinity Zn(2+) transporter zrt1 [Varicellaria rhodocarpa]